MKEIRYKCDRCGAEITDVAYSLKCYAEDVSALVGGISAEAASQNLKQNLADSGTKHLCRVCKDELTDCVFIV